MGGKHRHTTNTLIHLHVTEKMWIKQINQKKNIVINNDDKQNFSLFSNSNKHTNTRLTPSLYTLINGTHAMHKLITVLYIFHVKSGAETERIKSNEGKNFDIFFLVNFAHATDYFQLFSCCLFVYFAGFCWQSYTFDMFFNQLKKHFVNRFVLFRRCLCCF